MKRITQRPFALAVVFSIAMTSLAMAAPKSDSNSRYLSLYGRVIKINKKERALLVDDFWSKRLYLVKMPEGATFKVFFGMASHLDRPRFEDVYTGDWIRLRCIRVDGERLARLEDGRQVAVLTALR